MERLVVSAPICPGFHFEVLALHQDLFLSGLFYFQGIFQSALIKAGEFDCVVGNLVFKLAQFQSQA